MPEAGCASYGVALAGALNLLEIAIIYAQGFHSGECRHASMSLGDNRMAVMMIHHPDTKSDQAALVAEFPKLVVLDAQ